MEEQAIRQVKLMIQDKHDDGYLYDSNTMEIIRGINDARQREVDKQNKC